MTTMRTLRGLGVALAVLALGGCATRGGDVGVVWPAPPADAPSSQPIQPPPRPESAPSTVPTPVPVVPSKPATLSFPSDPSAISGQAVLSLMQQAQADRDAGKLDLAAASLERAVRIEPRNYFVWSSLASLYLAKGLPQQAESVAKKSNSLARGNPYVELANWQLIASSLQAQGDAVGALQAQARADEIQRTLATAGGG